MKIGIIGCGNIGSHIALAIDEGSIDADLIAILILIFRGPMISHQG